MFLRFAFSLGLFCCLIFSLVSCSHLQGRRELWVDQNGRALQLQELKAEVYFVSFVYTTCPGICPMTVSHLKRLESKVKKVRSKSINYKIILMTIEPHVDAPQVRQTFLKKHQVDPNRWHFLGASIAQTRKWAQQYQTTFSDREGPDHIMHSFRVLVLDRHFNYLGQLSNINDPNFQKIVDLVSHNGTSY